MHILQIHNFYQTPGGEDRVVNAEKQLLEAKKHIVIQYTRHNDEIKEYGLFKKIRFFAETVYSRKTFKELGKLINEQKPDIVHIHNVFPLISPSVYYCLKQHKIPVVQTLHNYRFLCPTGLLYTKNTVCERCKQGNTIHCFLNKCYKDSFLLSGLYAFTFWFHRKIKTFQYKIDGFIALTDFTKNKFIEGGFPEEKIEGGGNFLPHIEIKPDYNKENYAVFMGRLSEEKGLMTLLRAFRKTGKIKLKVAGKGDLEEELKKYLSENNMSCVEFLGFVSGEQKLEFLKKAMFSIIPSEWYENFPMSVLESFSAGTPVIASRIGGLTELVENGGNGLLFEPGNEDDLAEKINYLSENPDKALEMGEYARKFVEEKYSPKKHYNRLMEIYKTAIEENGRHCNS
jgi:glycosyltransferase involved in cell wall biosynthesis